MKVVIQRVTSASVTVDGATISAIGKGLLIFVGIEDLDNFSDISWISNKIINIRIFDDKNQVPNISIKENLGDILLISQFTLHASTKKGNRPGYLKASKAAIAIPVYEKLITQLEKDLGKKIFTGRFGANMKIASLNDGPVTILMDTKNKE
ncbi:MAG: D-aminoacyl-tRNA deacylase [Ferruginibacter sp.]